MTAPVRLRGLARADLPVLLALVQAIEVEDRTDEHYSLADLEEEYADPLLEPERDWIGAFADDVLVGYVQLTPRSPSEGRLTMYSGGGVHPERRGRGIGAQLVTALVDRMRDRHREQPGLEAVLLAGGLTSDKAQQRLFTTRGFVADRYRLVLGVDPLVPTTVPELPRGMRIRGYDPAADGEALRIAHNHAFLGHHPNFATWDEGMWRQWVTGNRNFRPDLSFLVVDDDADGGIAAYVQTNVYAAVEEATGRKEAYIAKVGTSPEHRGRGLASAVLRHTLDACHRAGLDRACLDVDSDNPSGAVGLYERAGFALEQHFTDYKLTAPPLG
ncbi:GNAT family N-acetyltransferase [Nocardioides massiliensis]|uniref:Mycothiol synthase n=1 Tax=Nocardioides massiliensis TaxID=1325935 RepID=A0ABT9NR23_9ACTN|nr:GNAT family N-acetyltransferase [Nocardioides massiliensis]MDP9822881.1 mycothiol synthase [Nocardioides massiliensis]